MNFAHIGFGVKDLEKNKKFYRAAIASLGLALLNQGKGYFSIGSTLKKKNLLWIVQGRVTSPFHVAFEAKSRADVDAFYRAALKAGGKDNGAPGVRKNYSPTYYAAFVLDPNGHNIEAVYRG
jgi:catechol 2,3-dioxygenase-like lactoylglutathione lyase family enzyme